MSSSRPNFPATTAAATTAPAPAALSETPESGPSGPGPGIGTGPPPQRRVPSIITTSALTISTSTAASASASTSTSTSASTSTSTSASTSTATITATDGTGHSFNTLKDPNPRPSHQDISHPPNTPTPAPAPTPASTPAKHSSSSSLSSFSSSYSLLPAIPGRPPSLPLPPPPPSLAPPPPRPRSPQPTQAATSSHRLRPPSSSIDSGPIPAPAPAPADAANPRSSLSRPLPPLPPPSVARSHSRSRSGSLGGVIDGLRNSLNRHRSSSAASNRRSGGSGGSATGSQPNGAGSHHHHLPPPPPPPRPGPDAGGLAHAAYAASAATAGAQTLLQTKLLKFRRPSATAESIASTAAAASAASAAAVTHTGAVATPANPHQLNPVPPLELGQRSRSFQLDLPPIIALPSLEQAVQESADLASWRFSDPDHNRRHHDSLADGRHLPGSQPTRPRASSSSLSSVSTALNTTAAAGLHHPGDDRALPPPPPADQTDTARGPPAFMTSAEVPAGTVASAGAAAVAAAAAMFHDHRPADLAVARAGPGPVHPSASRASSKPHDRPSQKIMLSRALQRANMAVQLDNSANFEGARQSYIEACNLLHDVVQRTPSDEDRRKLEAIRTTYTARIVELDQSLPPLGPDKALPARPDAYTYDYYAYSDDGNSNGNGNSNDDDSGDGDHSGGDDDDEVEEEDDDLDLDLDGHAEGESEEPAEIYPYSLPHDDDEETDETNGLAPPPPVMRRSASTSRERTRQDELLPLQSSFSRAAPTQHHHQHPPQQPQQQYMPPPLSPRRSGSPDAPIRSDFSSRTSSVSYGNALGHVRAESHDSVSASWLDPIDESCSTGSSVHSRSSSMRIRRRRIRSSGGDAEAEFDAALDAAVEAAYDDGFEPADDDDHDRGHDPDAAESDDEVLESLREARLAKEQLQNGDNDYNLDEDPDRYYRRPEYPQQQQQLQQQQQQQAQQAQQAQQQPEHGVQPALPTQPTQPPADFFDDNSSDDEERMLEEMTRGYTIEDFAFGALQRQQQQQQQLQNAALARESGSSSMTTRTWQSSAAGSSNPPTGHTTLTTVSELATSSLIGAIKPSEPPVQSLAAAPPSGPTVRSRRLSGQNPKQLKIETSAPFGTPNQIFFTNDSDDGAADPAVLDGGRHHSHQHHHQNMALSARPATSFLSRPLSPGTRISPSDAQLPPPPPPPTLPPPPLPPPPPPPPPPHEGAGGGGGVLAAARRPSLRKNYSASSLRSIGRGNNRKTSAGVHDDSDLSPGTSSTVPASASNPPAAGNLAGRLPALPALPTPLTAAFRDQYQHQSYQLHQHRPVVDGMYLLDDNLHSPDSPGTPNSAVPGGPVPLEPCPTDFTLRPFWMMRCLYQTLAHPHGGYLSNRLFVPRDVWKVKGVKLRNVEDKMASCDLLTAALLKLARVDGNDADAVLEEMQAFELVLDQVQSNLVRRLGSEVGPGAYGLASSSLMSSSTGGGDHRDSVSGSALGGGPRASSVMGSTKTSTFSWKRLRSKTSTPGFGAGAGAGGGASGARAPTAEPAAAAVESGGGGGGGNTNGLTPASLPMTAHPTARPPKRDFNQVHFTGPNASYMSSLARLFDAVQVIDQIARQVDDPGLRHVDKTQVGLELSTRRAAEFFGFYICRFVMTDLTLLMDKFIKRGSEWVLA